MKDRIFVLVSDETKAKLGQLHDLYMQNYTMESFAGFAYGLKLGALLTLEITE